MAAATSDVDLECPVCHEEFKQPKFLSCTHVVCSKCVLSWLSARGQGGCPLCRAPILQTSQPQSADLSAIVDSLPTDFATMSLIESQRALSADQECTVCDSLNATSYCLHCGVKLCKSCKNVHAKLPATRDHDIEDLKSLTAARLAASRRSPCDLHPDKMAELFCHQHKKLICLLCSSAHHRACSGVGTVGDVAVQARGEFQQQAQRLRNKEGDVTTKEKQLDQTMRDALTHFKTCHAELKATFHDLRQQLDKREQKIAAQVQQHQDDVMSRMQDEKAALERQRVSIAAHAGSVERLIIPSPDSALLGMLEKLKARLDDLETQQQTTGGAGNVALKSAVFDKDVVTRLMREIGALGQVTYTETAPSSVTPVQPAKQPSHLKTAHQQPAQQQTTKQPPDQQQPAKPQPAQQQPAQQEPAQQQTAQQPPAQHQSAKPQPAKQQPAQQQAAKQPSAQQQPAKQPSAQQQPAKQPPAQQQPAKPQPAYQQPAQQQPTNQPPGQQQPALQQPAKQQPAQQQPNLQQPAKHQSAKQQSAQQQPQATGGGSKPTGAELARVLKVGDRVRRGQDWRLSWRHDEDGRGPGTLTAVPSRIWRDRHLEPAGGVDVRWDNGREGAYCMGYGVYELELA